MRLSFIVTLLVGLIVGIGTPNAEGETFTKPTYKGNRCLVQGLAIRLRQGAATAYCDSLGLGNATNYAIDANIGRKPTRMIDRHQCHLQHDRLQRLPGPSPA